MRGLPLIPKTLWPSAPHNRTWFNEFVLWIDRFQLPNVRQVVDVGANHGDFSQAASALYPEAKVLLAEPLQSLHAELQRRSSERAGLWSLAPYALGRERGTATLYVDDTYDAIASLADFSQDYLKLNPKARPSSTATCEVRTLDDVCAELGIQRIDLLKIDVEGFEFEVLAGAKSMLPRTNAIVIEVSLVRRSEDHDALERLLQILRENGLELVDVYPSFSPASKAWQPAEFNVLARRSKLVE